MGQSHTQDLPEPSLRKDVGRGEWRPLLVQLWWEVPSLASLPWFWGSCGHGVDTESLPPIPISPVAMGPIFKRWCKILREITQGVPPPASRAACPHHQLRQLHSQNRGQAPQPPSLILLLLTFDPHPPYLTTGFRSEAQLQLRSFEQERESSPWVRP